MLDIDFLKTPRSVGGVLIYFYRSGVLRRRMRDCVAASATADGNMLISVSWNDLVAGWSAPSLLPGIRYCELSNNRLSRAVDRETLIDVVKLKPAAPTVVFAPFDSGIRDAVRDVLEVVEEPVVTETNLAFLLEFLVEQSEFFLPREGAEYPEFEQYFRRWLEGAGSASLIELSREVDRALLLYVDRETRRFVAPLETEFFSEAPPYIVRALSRVLRDDNPNDVVDLLRAVSLKVDRGWTPRELADDLCRGTRLLVIRAFRAGDDGEHESTAADVERLWLWSVILLTSTQALKGGHQKNADDDSSQFLVVVEQIHREFCRRTASKPDPLANLWSAIANLVSTLGSVDESRWDSAYLLFQSLLKFGQCENEAQWIRTLRRLVRSSLPATSELSAIEFSHPTLNSFSEFFGRPDIVSHLRGRFERNDHKRPIAIVGERFTGKKAIARLYAKALLCEDVGADGERPCKTCANCTSFDTAPPFGYIEIDLHHPSAAANVRDHILALDRVSFSEHRVIVLKNPDGTANLLDLALKPFEDGACVTTFIVLAEREDAVRPSVLSRCDVFRLRGLGPEDCRNMLQRWLPKRADERVAEVVAILNGGLPGGMVRSARVVRDVAWDLEGAKVALGIDWGADALLYWRSMFTEQALPLSVLELPSGVRADKAMQRLRAILWRLERHHVDGEAALIGLEEQFSAVVSLMDACKKGLERDVFVELGALWQTDATLDVESYRNISMSTKALLTRSV